MYIVYTCGAVYMCTYVYVLYCIVLYCDVAQCGQSQMCSVPQTMAAKVGVSSQTVCCGGGDRTKWQAYYNRHCIS